MTSFGYSDGILTQMPKYYENVSYVHTCEIRFASIDMCCIMTLNVTGFNNCCSFTLSRDSHIGYSKVMVVHPDGSSSEHQFYSSCDYMDAHSPGWASGKNVYCATDYLEISDPSSSIPTCMAPPTSDYSRIRGREKKVTEYDAMGAIVSSTTNIYSPYGATIMNLMYNNLFAYNNASYTAYSPQLICSIKTENGVTTTTDTEYNSLGQVQMQTVSSQVTDPEAGPTPGELIQTTRVRTRYLHESRSSTPLLSAADAIVVTDVGDTYSERIIFAQNCTYPANGNSNPNNVTTYAPSNVALPSGEDRSGIFSRALGGSGRTVSYEYDGHFRPITVTLPGAETFTYCWQNGVRVTQKTQGSAANRTLFQWKDLVGLSSLTTPDGQRQSYVYDDRNRLKRISDRNGKPVTRYNYKMKNESTTNN